MKAAWTSALLQALREEASLNILSMSVTADTSHDPTSWLKEEAPKNIRCMVVTADTFHDPMSRSKEEALRNIPPTCVTADMFQEPMSWLKEVALLNMPHISLTADTSHAEMSGLHVLLPVMEPPPLLAHHDVAQNSMLMLVTALTSHPEMWPYAVRAAASSLHHRSAAACRSQNLSPSVPIQSLASHAVNDTFALRTGGEAGGLGGAGGEGGGSSWELGQRASDVARMNSVGEALQSIEPTEVDATQYRPEPPVA